MGATAESSPTPTFPALHVMNKAFTREVDREDEEDDDVAAPVLPSGAKNYVTVAGYQRLRQEPGGPTAYDTVEEFSGPLVPFAGPARVAEGFQRHADALKRRSEELAASRG